MSAYKHINQTECIHDQEQEITISYILPPSQSKWNIEKVHEDQGNFERESWGPHLREIGT